MSYTTPTTNDVRDIYAYAETYSAFDDWLEQHDAEIAKATEQRIIKILDKRLTTVLFDILVALIKGEGENK